MKDDLNIERDVLLNKLQLDTAAEEQSELYRRYSLVDVAKEELMRKAKDQLDYIKAKVDLAIRAQEPKPKPTEATIKAMVEINPEVREAKMKLNEAIAVSHAWKGALGSLRQKKDMITVLTRAYASNYFSTPSDDGEI